MAEDLEPLIWKVFEKGEKDDNWPKRNYGASLIHLMEDDKYFLIGGNHDAYQNEKTYVSLNNDLINAIDEGPTAYQKAAHNKLNYIGNNLSENYYAKNQIDVYVYDMEPESKWYKMTSSGNVPKARSGHQCINIGQYIFLFGGVELGPKSENLSSDELYVLNTRTFVWKKIVSNNSPYNRTDFKWIKLDKIAYLYGGCSSPSEKFYNDLWMFKYQDQDFFDNEDNKSSPIENMWRKIDQLGQGPGKVKAYAMEYNQGYLYLFGGIDNTGTTNNTMYKFDLDEGRWEIAETKGYPPCPRSYHNMAKINPETFVVFGGIIGTIRDTKEFLNDVYLFNTRENIWVIPVIGGLVPSPRIGCCFCSNYHYDHMGIMVFGGYTPKENENSLKLYFLTENDKNSNYFWTIRSNKYKEEQNDDNFLLETEKSIYEYKEKIANLELDTQSKELASEEMRKINNEHKKKFFQQHGFIEDQSQTLEEQINEQENQKNKMQENFEIDKEITELKQKLRYVMEKKTEKTMDFFNETCGIFLNYYDAVNKMAKAEGDIFEDIQDGNFEAIKEKYCQKLETLKEVLQKSNDEEEKYQMELHRFPKFEDKSCEDIFEKEIEKYEIPKKKKK
ncbi:MAG: hypothetical protein MJ252_07660 [archaeon]|nr:hypothetical protein [archaeon]